MSAKLLYNLSDENPDLHKQIGCMNGIFQVFYRQRFPSQRISGHGHRSLSPGQTSSEGSEPSSALHKRPGRNIKNATKEKQRVSTESSSRASFSSSPRSSSFSSADISATSQFEPPAITQTNFPTNPNQELPKFQSNVYHRPLDVRDVVKGSFHRETKGLSVKTTAKEEIKFQTLKYADSPRPLSHPKSAKASVSLLKESFLAPKDTPRLSYDEREVRNGQKSVLKLKELPRLSLDSRENSMRNSRAEMKSNCPPGDMSGQQETGSHRRSTSSIVAKLMGLDIPQDSTSTDYNQTAKIRSIPAVDHTSFSRSAIITDDSRQNQFCNSPRVSQREAASPRTRNADLIKQRSANSNCPMELAPWKQPDGTKDKKSALKIQSKTQNSTVSVYGEIQKRLAQLEFKKSGKDLRALKQILDAMEKTQQIAENRKDNLSSSASMTIENPSLVQRSNHLLPASTIAINSTKNFKSSIVIMKRAQAFERTSDSASALGPNQKDMTGKQTAMDLTPRPNCYKGQLHSIDRNTSTRLLRSKQTSKETYPMKADKTKQDKNQTSVSLRLQQKKLGLEKPSRPTSPSSDSSKTQRKQTESASPRRKPRIKSRSLQQNDDQLSDISNDMRSLSHQSDIRSLRSESNISLVSNADTEVTSKYRVEKIFDNSEQHTPKQKSPDLRFIQHTLMPEPVKVTLEQPSPVSVLDATFYGDESPSPVRKISTAFKEEDSLISEEAEWMNEDTSYLSSFRRHTISELDEFFIDETASPLDITNPDHKYISEILLASGLLRDLEYSMITIQLHQSRLPINSNLFLVLERTKKSNEVLQGKHKGKRNGWIEPVDKVRRKLVFDTVNEILAQKFISESCPKTCIPSNLHMHKRPRGQQLLQNLCSEIDRLQGNNSICSLNDEEDIIWEDLKHQGVRSTDFHGETPGIVLDIERLIFKDLINEVVTGEVAALRGGGGGHHRQLFTN